MNGRPVVARSGGRARYPGDLLRVLIGSVVIAITAAAAATHRVSRFEEDAFRLINGLPEALRPVLTVVMQLGTIGAAIGLAVVAVAARRLRLGRDIAIGGLAAWFTAKFLKEIVGRERPFGALEAVFRHSADVGLGYPSGHSAVSAAIVTAAAPYLGPRQRQLAWGAVALVGIARIYVGAHLPLDVIGGWALGWVLGSLVHVAFPVGHDGSVSSC